MSVKAIIKSLTPKIIRDLLSDTIALRALFLKYQANKLRQSHPNPLCRYGAKCFSQTDEDGITLEILRRINCLHNGVFAEFGVGNGTENNTLILKALGWRGFWVGAEKPAFEISQPKDTFSYFQEWITLDNIEALTIAGCLNLGCKEIDVISLDLDGNDIYFVESLLKNGHTPKLFIVEYNARFIPPVKWQIDYDASNAWQGDDYFGASLATFNELFSQYDYRLVCCNAQTGSNAFFVRERYLQKFADVPTELEKLYAPSSAQRQSMRTIAKLFA